jgi:DNA-binding MarR family transcriptional regulator
MSDKSAAVAEIIDNIRRVFQVVHERSKRAEQRTGLTGPQLWAIKTIAQESPISVSEIARRMYLHPATVVGILDRLEKRQLVSRVRSIEDRRVVRVELTASGEALVRTSPEVAQGILISGLESLPPPRLRTIAGALDQLVDILGAQDLRPEPLLSSEVTKPQQQETKRGGHLRQ